MFIVDAAVLLPHPPPRVARVVGRLTLLPRWCAGLRRVRFPALPAGGVPAGAVPAGAGPADDGPAVGCVFTYAAADVRLTLRARTLAPAAPGARVVHAADGEVAGSPASDPFASAAPVRHTAAGDGLTLTWTLSAEPPDGTGAAASWAAPLVAALPGTTTPAVVDRAHTRLRARLEVLVDPGHPLAAARAALCRTVARRVPADLERLRLLLERYEGGRPPGPRLARDAALGGAPSGDVAPVRARR